MAMRGSKDVAAQIVVGISMVTILTEMVNHRPNTNNPRQVKDSRSMRYGANAVSRFQRTATCKMTGLYYCCRESVPRHYMGEFSSLWNNVCVALNKWTRWEIYCPVFFRGASVTVCDKH